MYLKWIFIIHLQEKCYVHKETPNYTRFVFCCTGVFILRKNRDSLTRMKFQSAYTYNHHWFCCMTKWPLIYNLAETKHKIVKEYRRQKYSFSIWLIVSDYNNDFKRHTIIIILRWLMAKWIDHSEQHLQKKRLNYSSNFSTDRIHTKFS